MNVLVSLLMAAATTCPVPKDLVLVGMWESRSTSKGGIGTVVQFRSDGTVVQTMTVLVNLSYAISGDQLMINNIPEGKPSPETATRFKADAETFIRYGADGSEVPATRIGSPVAGSNPIVGSWRYRHYTGAIAFEHFTQDGRLAFRLPMKAQVDCYDVDSTTRKVMVSTSDGDRRLQFDLAGDELKLTSGDHAWDYGRAEWGSWYDVEHIDYDPPKVPGK